MLKAESVAERGDSFYEATSDISCMFHIITYCREAPELSRLIAKFEDFFEESKPRFVLRDGVTKKCDLIWRNSNEKFQFSK